MLIKEIEAFADVFPPSGLFAEGGRSIGAFFEAGSLPAEGRTIEELASILKSAESWFDWQPGVVFQIILDDGRAWISIRKDAVGDPFGFVERIERFRSRSPVPLRRAEPPEIEALSRRFLGTGDSPGGGDLLRAKIVLSGVPRYTYPGSLLGTLRFDFPMVFSLNFEFDEPGENETGIWFSSCAFVTASSESELSDRLKTVTRRVRSFLGVEAIAEVDWGPASQSRGAGDGYPITRIQAASLVPIFDRIATPDDCLALCLTEKNEWLRFRAPQPSRSSHVVVIGDSNQDRMGFVAACAGTFSSARSAPVAFIVATSPEMVSTAERAFRKSECEWLDFRQNLPMPLNPFRGAFDAAHIRFAAQFLATAIELNPLLSRYEKNHESMLAAAIEAVVNRKLLKSPVPAEIEITVREIAKEVSLLSNGIFRPHAHAIIESLMERLLPFHGNGIYSQFLSGAGNTPKRDTTPLAHCYDVRAIAAHRILGVLACMAICEDVRRTLQRPEYAGRPAYLLIEEPILMGGETRTGERFLSEWYRNARIQGTHLATITTPEEASVPGGPMRQVWKNADHLLFLQSAPERIHDLARANPDISRETQERIHRLSPKRNGSLELLHMNRRTHQSSVFHLMPPPETREKRSREADLASELDRMSNEGGIQQRGGGG